MPNTTATIKVLKEYSNLPNEYEPLNPQENQENIVILDDFLLTKEAQVASSQNSQTEAYQRFFNEANNQAIGILGKVTSEANISSSLATYEQRNQIIKELYHQVLAKHYQGICIDFEKIDDVNNFNRFLIELTPKFRESGLKVIVKANELMNPEKIKHNVDFII